MNTKQKSYFRPLFQHYPCPPATKEKNKLTALQCMIRLIAHHYHTSLPAQLQRSKHSPSGTSFLFFFWWPSSSSWLNTSLTSSFFFLPAGALAAGLSPAALAAGVAGVGGSAGVISAERGADSEHERTASPHALTTDRYTGGRSEVGRQATRSASAPGKTTK